MVYYAYIPYGLHKWGKTRQEIDRVINAVRSKGQFTMTHVAQDHSSWSYDSAHKVHKEELKLLKKYMPDNTCI